MDKETSPTFETEKKEIDFGNKERIKLQEAAFDEYIVDGLVEVFEKELRDAGFDDSAIQDFVVAESEDKERDINYVKNMLAVPWELRNTWIQNIAKKGLNGTDAYIALKKRYEMDKEWRESQGETLPRIGYHVSPVDIPVEPSRTGAHELAWEIIGTEKSELAPDGLIACASEDYESLHRQGAPHYLYVISITDDRKRYNEKWYWDRKFPVVAQFPLGEVDAYVDDYVAGKKKQRFEDQKTS